MSKIALTPSATGTGVFTIASPATSTDRTLTLPDITGTLVSTDASGNVGIGVVSPASKLEVAVTDTGSIQEGITIKGTQTNGYGGYLGWKDSWSGDSYTGYRGAILADVPSADAGRIRFFTASGGTLSERMRIDSSGNVLVGTTVVHGTNSKVSVKTEVDKSGIGITAYKSSNSNYYFMNFIANTTSVGDIYSNGSSTTYATSSDYRLKENVESLVGASERVNQLLPKRFNFINDETNTLVDGFLAHEVQSVVPEAILGTHNGMKDEEYEVTAAVLDADGTVVTEAVMGTRSVPDYQGIDQSKLVPLLTAALQEALTEISALKVRVAALEAV